MDTVTDKSNFLSQDLSYTSAFDIAAAIRAKKLSPREVLEFFIKRIETRNHSLNALVFTAFDEARAAAKQAEDAVMRGKALKPLHGVPVAIKDMSGFRPGWPATFGGIRALKNFKSDFWSSFPERIEQRGGAITVGRTNSPIMGFRGLCDNYLFGPTSTPFAVGKNSGGSSGGSAAAVADGLLPLAEGSDGGGSIRIPSAWCGVYGYKASFGRLPYWSRPNAFLLNTPFTSLGPITRTVKDAALAMSVLQGYDARDPYSLDETVDFLAACQKPIKGMKIAWSPNFDVFPVEPEVAHIVKRALSAFEEAGAHVEEVKLGIKRSQRELSDLWCRLNMPRHFTRLINMKALGYDLLGQHREDLPPEYLEWIDRCMNITAVEFFRDQTIRTEVYDAVQGAFRDHDLLVTPTLACLPVDNSKDGNTLGPRQVAGEAVDPIIGWCLTYPLNFSGNPAASIPAGLSKSGLPVGMQIVGARYADLTVIAASAEFERRRPWAQTYEKCRQRPL
jgi:amidase/aspartyl-tRNA(Asn)/glutamyl-tRNA(Gln) amidotransferase subunit A